LRDLSRYRANSGLENRKTIDWENVSVDAIPLGIPTSIFADYQLQTREDPKAYDYPIRGRISPDCAKTPTRARVLSLLDKLIPDINS
jgi:hypothetical protein